MGGLHMGADKFSHPKFNESDDDFTSNQQSPDTAIHSVSVDVSYVLLNYLTYSFIYIMPEIIAQYFLLHLSQYFNTFI